MSTIIEINEDSKELGDFVITEEKVGETFWSQLYKATHKSKEETYMAKVLDLSKRDASDRAHLKERAFKIIPYLITYPNPNIVACHGIFYVNKTKLVVIEELLVLTLEAVVKKEGSFDEAKAKVLAKALGQGIAYLHDLGVAHQNISVQNVYRNSEGAIKLSAIEYATIFWDSDSNELRLHKCVRKLKRGRHIAPEITNGVEYDPTKADSYSFGVFICYLLLGSYPYDSERRESEEVQWDNAFQQVDKSLGETGRDLLKRLLKSEPSERLVVKEALGHAWFSQAPLE